MLASLDFGDLFGKFGVDWHLITVQIVNFGIVATILYKFGVKNLMKMMDERREKIKSGLEYADKMKIEMSEFERTRESRNNAAKQEAAEIVRAAKDDAKSIIDNGKIESQQIVDGMILNAKKEIKSEREQMLSDTKCEIGQLVADIAERLLISQMTEKQRSAYVALAEKMICTKDVA